MVSTTERFEFLRQQKDLAKCHNRLYHCTTVDALLNIIRTKMLWLSNLEKVNDPFEKDRIDYKEYKQSCYVGCFTYDKQLSPHHWEEYGNGISDVVLGINNDLFWEKDLIFIRDNKPLIDSKYWIYGNRMACKLSPEQDSNFFIENIGLYQVHYETKHKINIAESDGVGNYVIPALAALTKDPKGLSIKTGNERDWNLEKKIRLTVVINQKNRGNKVEYPQKNGIELNNNIFNNMEVMFGPSVPLEKVEEYKLRITDALGKHHAIFGQYF